MKILKSQSILLFLLVAPTLQPEVVEANKDSIATDAKSSSSILSSEFRISLLESRLSTLADQIEDLKRVDRCIGSNYQEHTEEIGKNKQTLSTLPLAPASKRDGYPRLAPLKRRSITDDKRQANIFRGEPGRNGLDGLDGAPGLDGVPGTDGRDGKDGTNGRDGKDGKDGLPGERGPVGPPGPPGEAGRRGKQGPPGKTGAPGLPGVCAYKAKFDCSSSLVSSESNRTKEGGSDVKSESVQAPIQALLMAPTIIGQEHSESGQEIERQVTVKEGDYIQLSCEAVGLPRPSYAWRRPEKSSVILLDPVTDLRVTSFPGSQLPFMSVDRLQAGPYECIASNGVPPDAVKQITLDVNYSPTIRLYPGPSVYQVSYGSSILIECIVDASPSSFSYWMFGSDLIMSIAPPSETRQADTATAAAQPSQPPNKHNKKYIITESTGQLLNGAYYSILTLNITNIARDDLGLYKCVSKNLIGQSTGYAWLESLEDLAPIDSPEPKYKEMILGKVLISERLDHTIGWPNYLTERDSNYSTFGNEHRQRLLNSSLLHRSAPTNSLSASQGSIRYPLPFESSAYFDSDLSTPLPRAAVPTNLKDKGTSDAPTADTSTDSKQPEAPTQHQNENESNQSSITVDDVGEEVELCLVEKTVQQQQPTKTRQMTLLLDQVGKPVYVGSVAGSSLNWWSLDTRLSEATAASANYYATFSNISDQLFEYKQLSELLKGPAQVDRLDQTQSETRRSYKLRYPMIGNSRLIHGMVFLYTTTTSSKARGLSDYRIVAHNLTSGKKWHLQMDEKILKDINNQPVDLGSDYKMDRVELLSDEIGIWVVFPTIEPKFEPSGHQNRLSRVAKTRRLHALKLKLVTAGQSGADSFEVEYHVNMKLDWQMIGQMFIIDGVLYGIKDRHLYSSKLQFAYDLYKCKLLSTEYLNEPLRTFNNHFGNTQMIRYNPNEPKRFYTIDNGNLLWCPVKLTMVNQTEI